VFINYKK